MGRRVGFRRLALCAAAALAGAALLALIALEAYAWIAYGGKPVGEIPAWALWLMFGS